MTNVTITALKKASTTKCWPDEGTAPRMSRKPPSLSGWHPEDVKAAVRKKGVSLSALAEMHGFGPSYLRNTLMRPLFEGEQIIARFLGVAPQEIWPKRYDESGNPDYRHWRTTRDARRRRAA